MSEQLLMLPSNDINRALVPGDDESPSGYRKRVYQLLSERYRDIVNTVMELLEAKQFELRSMSKIHKIELRRALIERQSLPFILTHEALFAGEPLDARVLAACLAGHTLSLTQLDYHLDGAPPEPTDEVTAVQIGGESAVSYAVRMVYFAGALLGETGLAGRVFEEVFDPISGFVIERMHEDWLSRWDDKLLNADANAEASAYLRAPTSRLMASAYWEVMCRGAFIARRGEGIPHALTAFCGDLRRLRQLVDEAADVDVDLQSGLLTLPVLLAQTLDASNNVLTAPLHGLWAARHDDTVVKDSLVQRISQIVRCPDVGERLQQIADEFSEAATDALATLEPGTGSASLGVLVELKRAKLAMVLDAYAGSQKIKRHVVSERA